MSSPPRGLRGLLFLAAILWAIACGSGSRPGVEADASTDSSTTSTDEDNAPGWEMAWVISAGGPSIEWGAELGGDCVLLEDGSSLVAGKLMQPAVFGPMSDNPVNVQSFGSEDMVLARLDPGGDPIWVRSAGGSSHDQATSLSLVPDGGVMVSGYGENGPIFAAGEPEETTLTDLGMRDLFLARYDLDGRLEWVAGAGGDYTATRGSSVAVLEDRSVVVGGTFYGVDTGDGPGTSITFGYGTAGETAVEGVWGRDGVIASYFADGDLNWAVLGCAGVGDDTLLGLAADGDTFVAFGRFEDEVVCEGRSGNQVVLSSAGDSSLFLARYSEDGDLLWARDLGVDGRTHNFMTHRAVRILKDGDIALTAEYAGTMLAGLDGELEPVGHSNNQFDTIFLGRYDPSGETRWVATARGLLLTSDFQEWRGMGLAELDDGSIALVGSHASPTVFGEGEENETVLEGSYTDGFLALYRPDGHLEWAIGQRGGGWVLTMGVAARGGSILLTGLFRDAATFGTGSGDTVELESAGEIDMFVMRLNRADTPEIPN